MTWQGTHIDRRDLWKGLRVAYRFRPRGGYGYWVRIPATVVELKQRKVLISAETPAGPITLLVGPSSLYYLSRDDPQIAHGVVKAKKS